MLMKIGDITSKFGISHRSLHYWEDMGIIKSFRAENDYRYYDEENQQKIRQILVLRKLRLPLKQIIMVLESDSTVGIIDTLQRNLNEVDDEISALSTIRSILDSFIAKLNQNIMIDIKVNLLDDSTILEITDSLTVTRPALKEEKTSEDLIKADKILSVLNDVRIVYLPPFTAAAIRCFNGEREAEHYSSVAIHEFIKKNDLIKLKPDLRYFGFNNDNNGVHGYEEWVTIPDDMEIAPPYEKKRFAGGLYAAHLMRNGDFGEWELLEEWVDNHELYTIDEREPKGMGGWLEETFTSIYLLGLADKKSVPFQLDMLMPIKLRGEKKKPESLGYIENSEAKCGYRASLIQKDGFTIAGYTTIIHSGVTDLEFSNALAADGRLERIKSFLKKGALILGYRSYDAECAKYSGYRYTVCVDLKDTVDPKKFKTDDMFVKKLPPKKWIQFEIPMDVLLSMFTDGGSHHQLVRELGYKFSGAGHLEVYLDGVIELNQANKNKLYLLMPVVPL